MVFKEACRARFETINGNWISSIDLQVPFHFFNPELCSTPLALQNRLYRSGSFHRRTMHNATFATIK